MNLFIFFALPFSTILLAIVLQKVLKSPILVAITFFSIYLIATFTAFLDFLAEALIATIIYTVVAYITALIVMSISRLKHRFCNHQRGEELVSQRRCSCDDSEDNSENNLHRISCSCGNSDGSSDLLTANSTCHTNSIENGTEDISSINTLTKNQYINGKYSNRRCFRRV